MTLVLNALHVTLSISDGSAILPRVIILSVGFIYNYTEVIVLSAVKLNVIMQSVVAQTKTFLLLLKTVL
jgi:hypothetical protein